MFVTLFRPANHGAIHHVRQALRPAVVPGHGLPFVRLPQGEGGRRAGRRSAGSASKVGRQLDVFVEPTQGTQACGIPTLPLAAMVTMVYMFAI